MCWQRIEAIRLRELLGSRGGVTWGGDCLGETQLRGKSGGSGESKKKKGKSWRITDGGSWIKFCKDSGPLNRMSWSFFITPEKPTQNPQNVCKTPQLKEQNASTRFSLREFPVGQLCPAPQHKGLTRLRPSSSPSAEEKPARAQTLRSSVDFPMATALPNAPILLPETRSLREGEAPTSFSLRSHEGSLLHPPFSFQARPHHISLRAKPLGNQGITEAGKDL